MQAVSKAILATIRVFIGVMLMASVLLICANAVGRYVFLAPIIWAEEVLGYVLVWTVYLGAVLVTWDGGHLKMDLVSRTMTGVPRFLINGLSTLGFVVIGGIILYQSWFAIEVFTHNSMIAEIPMNWMHSAIPLSFILMLIFIAVRIRGYLDDSLERDLNGIEGMGKAPSAAKPETNGSNR